VIRIPITPLTSLLLALLLSVGGGYCLYHSVILLGVILLVGAAVYVYALISLRREGHGWFE
jgi:hypothetical protein